MGCIHQSKGIEWLDRETKQSYDAYRRLISPLKTHTQILKGKNISHSSRNQKKVGVAILRQNRPSQNKTNKTKQETKFIE